LALVVGILAGCGGAGSPGTDNLAVSPAGDVAPQANDYHLANSWLLVSGTANGVVSAPSQLVVNWPTGTTREVLTLRATGKATDAFYNASGGVVAQRTGTWSGIAGRATIHWPLTTIGPKVTINLTYTFPTTHVTKWHFTVTKPALLGGTVKVAIVANYANLTASLTQRDPALVGTWKATALMLNSVTKSLDYLSGSSTYPYFARAFLSNSHSQAYALGMIGNQEIELPQPATTTWATGGGVIKYLAGQYQSSIYKLTGSTLTIYQLDANGNTLQITFTRYGAAGAHLASLVNTWHTVSGKIDGATQPLSSIFTSWPGGTTAEAYSFRSDGTMEDDILTGTAITYSNLDTWYTATGTLHLGTPFGPAAYGLVVGSGSWTMTWTTGGHSYSVLWQTGI
jgi:hypothetical protein